MVRTAPTGHLWLILMLMLAWTGAAWAGPQTGDVELNSQLSFLNAGIDENDDEGISGDDSNLLSFQARLGYFVTANHEGEMGFTVVHDSGPDTTAFIMDFRYSYNFPPMGQVVPYAGPSLGLLHFTSDALRVDDTAFTFGGQLGLKTFLTEQFAVITEYSLRRAEGSDLDATTNGIFVGFSYLFR